jgi:chromosome segregation protein
MEMKGFKSFANRTEIVFGEKFNCVLGPNGSGKSNILDALCFVLGKAGAKGLRVEKSSNLIYNGGKTKKPSKEGEVSIWFDNSKKEFDLYPEQEIKLTRVIRTTGQGIYKINDVVKTRTQILDLMSMANIDPDGYNIILQGDIVRLIEMTTNDRRQIVEEIAGINVYEDKKNKALRELERVDTKINEADIILVEREAYLKELKKDRDQALKFKELEERKKRNKKTLLVNNERIHNNQISIIEEDISKNKDKIISIEELISKLREEISTNKNEIDNISKEIEEKGEKEQVKIHKEVEALKVSVAIDKQRLDTLINEVEKLKTRQEDLKNSYKELSSKTEHLEKEKVSLTKQIEIRNVDLKNIENRISEFRKKHNLQEETKLDENIDEMDKNIEKITLSMNDLREKQQIILREKDKAEMQLQSIDDKLEKVSQIKKEHKQELEMLKEKKQQFKKLAMDLSKALSESSEFALQLSNARNKLISAQEEHAKLNARKAVLMEQIAGGSAIQSILELRNKDPKIYGTVAELGTAKKEFGLALEIAAGSKIRSIVVEDDITAAKCIKFVKEKQLGVISVLPLNKLRDVQIDPNLRNMKTPGVKGLALDLMEYKSKFEIVFKHVFGNTLVVENIDVARKIGVGQARMVTLDGDITELSGAMQGGYRGKQKTTGAFTQEEINESIKKLEQTIADSSSVMSLLEKKASDNDELISRLRFLKAELEGEIIKTEKSLHLDSDEAELGNDEKKLLQKKFKELESEVDEIQDKISEENKKLAKIKIERQQIKDKIMDLRNPAKMAELQSFDDKRKELQQEIMKLESDRKHAISEMETIVGPENRKILDIMKQHDKEMQQFIQEQTNLRSKVSKDEKELTEKEKKQAKFYEQFKELFGKRSKLTDAVNKLEARILHSNADVRVLEQKINSVSLDLARLKAELAGILEELKYYLDIEVYENKSEEKMKRELSEFERMAEEIGAVNMRALEIYETVEKEYNSLLNKKDVLGKERTEVLAMINQIDSKKKDLFLKTFYSLEDNFKKFFSKLLVKGDASLQLENEEDPFAGGVEIKVRLTGTRFLDIRSLSGGEKTMTALAFLFAVQEYEPASFYVLDEVDAALDKKNAENLAQLIKDYSKKVQYVVISHNDGVISEAEKLYGVSMNEHGMSKITTLKI